MDFPLIKDIDLIKRHQRNLKKLTIPKKAGQLFEYEFSLFLSLLWPHILSEKPFKLNLKDGHTYEIDVLAVFPELVIATECKQGEGHNIKKDLSLISKYTGEVSTILRHSVPEITGKYNVLYILAYRNQIPSSADFADSKSSGIVLVDNKLLDAYIGLASTLKDSARDILFSDWLKGRKIRNLPDSENIILSTEGRFGNHRCYSFMASPYLLKKLCYVQRRHYQHTLARGSISYQRLIQPAKIKSIRKFIEDGNLFPSSVIINFEDGISFNPIDTSKADMKSSNPNIRHGYISPKHKYGCAIVVDGQHRIFGYSGLEDISKEHFLNVVAFAKLDEEEQAKVFAEINENQTPINKDVLWDLYEDIYSEDNPKAKISALVKKLNNNSAFFKDNIFIPSVSKNKKSLYRLHMNSVCRPLSAQANLFKKLLSMDKDRYFLVIDTFFDTLLGADELKKDWEDTEASFVLSNNGFEILAMVLNSLYNYLRYNYIDIKNITNCELIKHCREYAETIAKALIDIKLEVLRKSLGYSSAKAKVEVERNILISSGKFSGNFKKISNDAFLSGVREDLHNEFKSTLYKDKNRDTYSDEYFRDAILGTIAAFINSSVEGNLYVGITDDMKKEGIDIEVQEHFKNIDNVLKFIDSKLETDLITKDFNKGSIITDVISELPLILVIRVPGNAPDSEKAAAMVRSPEKDNLKAFRVYQKRASGKKRITKYFIAAFGETKGRAIESMISEYVSAP